MLRILHRKLLVELGLNALGTGVAVLALIFLGSLSLQLGKSGFDDLPISAILSSVALFVCHTLNLTLPLTVLCACLITYGRHAADGEFGAARACGVPPRQILRPALVLGAAVLLALTLLQDRVMSDAHFATRFVSNIVFTNIERVLQGAERRINGGKSFVATWGGRSRDAEGRLVLEDLFLVRFKDGKRESELTAKRAIPALSEGGDRLDLELYDVHRTSGDREGVESGGYLKLPIRLDALAALRSARRKASQLSYVELLAEANRAPDSPPARRARAEFHFRLALAFSGPLFALFGAPLGLRLRLSNRAYTLLIGVLVVTLAYWPLMAFGKRLAESGAAPPWIALHVANAILLVVGLKLTRDVRRA